MKEIDEIEGERGQKKTLQSLQYLCRLCSHPYLVFNWKLERHREALNEVAQSEITSEAMAKRIIKDIKHAPKLQVQYFQI